MKKIIIFAIILVVLASSAVIYKRYFSKSHEASQQENIVEQEKNTAVVEQPVAPQTEEKQPAEKIEGQISKIKYPMDNFNQRITINPFGNSFSGAKEHDIDQRICKGATSYSGYHTASDLEATSSESGKAIPVYAVTDGVVRRIGPATGYGGLLILEIKLEGSTYTAIYGHIDLKSAGLKVGDKVVAGQKLADLAGECTAANGMTRKHLHFGLHKGSTIDVRGYVSDKSILNNWVDPKALLNQLI